MTTAFDPGLTPEQRTRRRGFIGGTDAPRILGASRFGGPLQVYEEKMGLDVRRPPGPAARWGSILEGAIADEYARVTGRSVRRRKAPFIMPGYDFIGGYVDRMIVGEPGLLEVKTGSAFMTSDWGPAGTDEIPDDYYIQVQHYLMVTGLLWADVAVLVGGQDFRVYRVDRNAPFIDALLQAEITFWREHIEAAHPPPVGGTKHDAASLHTRYPIGSGTVEPATPEDELLIVDLATARRNAKAAEAALRLAENRIKERIGPNSGLAGSSGVVTWREQKSTRVDWKAIAHEWKNLFGLYVPAEHWERLTREGNDIAEAHTNRSTIRVLRVRGVDEEGDSDAE